MFNANFPFRIPPTGRDPNLPGDRYGRLTLVEEVAGQECDRAHAKWLCLCDCGSPSQASRTNLRSGHTTSCGCAYREAAALMGKARATHGLTKHQLFPTHNGMLARCYSPENKSFADYGGRGIQVCERWHSVENFIADMGPSHSPGLSLEREDNALGYSPENCVWATRIEQGRNQRSNRLVSYQGKNICLAEACEITGLNYGTVKSRLYRGWSIPRALESPSFQAPLLESAQTPGALNV